MQTVSSLFNRSGALILRAMPTSPLFRPESRFPELGEGFSDPVRPAEFPQARIRFRNDRIAARAGLEGLTDEEWIAAFARFEPLPGLRIELFPVPGKTPLWLEEGAVKTDEIGEGTPGDHTWPRPGELTVHAGEIEGSGLFEVTLIRHFDWEQIYDAEGYIALLDTFSGNIAMATWQRERLYGEIRRRLAQRPDGTLRRHWGAVLHVARRREAS